MNYLAFDTASAALKILLKSGGEYTYFQSDDFRSASEKLLPEADKLLKGAGIGIKDIGLIACVTGPGSFTGIRIGMSAAKAIAYALGIKIVAVNTLQLLAYNNNGKSDTVVAVCDAGNGYRYVAVYDEKCAQIMEPKCLKAEELSGFLSLIDEPHEVFCDEVSKISGGIVPSPDSFKRALIKAVERGAAADYNEIEPLYIRKPQAERDLEEK